MEFTNSVLKTAADDSQDSIVITDQLMPDDPIVYVNNAFLQLTGYTEEEVIGRNCRFLQGEDTDRGIIDKIGYCISVGEHCQVELINYRKDHSAFWNELSLSPVFNAKHELTNYIGIQRDISMRKASEAEREYQAFHDSLTGLYNRNFFNKILEKSLVTRTRKKHNFALIMIDLNDFKNINDTLGHMAGDEALIHVAQVLSDTFRKDDVIARWGGDEYIILIEDVSKISDLSEFLMRLTDAFNRPFIYDKSQIKLSVSIGANIVDGGCSDSGVLIKQADMAMYNAKVDEAKSYYIFGNYPQQH